LHGFVLRYMPSFNGKPHKRPFPLKQTMFTKILVWVSGLFLPTYQQNQLTTVSDCKCTDGGYNCARKESKYF